MGFRMAMAFTLDSTLLGALPELTIGYSPRLLGELWEKMVVVQGKSFFCQKFVNDSSKELRYIHTGGSVDEW